MCIWPHTVIHIAVCARVQVIRNEEIAVLVPVLLEALMDPSEKTQQALDALANTPFVHSIDPPSLGLIVPILR